MSNSDVPNPSAAAAPSDPKPKGLVDDLLSTKQLTEILVKHYKLNEGLFSIAIQFDVGTGLVGPDSENRTPGIVIGLKSIGLVSRPTADSQTVDAAELTKTAGKKLERKRSRA